MPKKTDRNVILRSYVLRRQGKTLDEILDVLSEQFKEDQIPDRSTISRHMKIYESELPNELAEDAPFKWSDMKEAPWEGSRAVLGGYAHYIANGYPITFGQFTKRHAKWIWRVSQALGPQGDMTQFDSFEAILNVDLQEVWLEDANALYHIQSLPTRTDILETAMEYAWREIHSILFTVELDTNDLDFWLAFSPWRSPLQLSKYHKSRDEFGGFRRVLWHTGNREWLKDVDPGLATFLKVNFPNSFPESEPTDEEYKTYVSALDGLLPSQQRIINRWVEAVVENPELWETAIEIWYMEFHRRLQKEMQKAMRNDDNNIFENHALLLVQIQEELNERQRQASKQQ